MRKKRYMTLLEIMIVILLIGVITSVVGYNMKGSLEKGKIFKTKMAKKQIEDILLLAVSSGADIDYVVTHYEAVIKESGLAKNSEKIIKDGWDEDFTITTNKDKTDIIATSKKLKEYQKKRKKELNLEEDDY